MASIVEVAKLANVSSMTVSRVLRGADSVRVETRQRILKIMSDHNYVPSKAACAMRSNDELRKRESTCFALVFGSDVCEATDFFCDVARAAEQEAARHGLCPVQVHWQATFEDTWPRLQTIFSIQGLCGVVLVGQFSEKVLRAILKKTDNVVMVDGPCPHNVFGVGSVEVDNFGGARLAFEHLLDSGSRRVLVLSGAHKNHYFSKALSEAALIYRDKFDLVDMEYTSLEGEAARKLICELWSSGRNYDAIFSNDEMAIGVLRAMSELGKRVPEDIKVIGFDGIAYSALTVPALTTIDIDRVQLGVEAVSCLVDIVRGNTDTTVVKKLIRPRLIKREST